MSVMIEDEIYSSRRERETLMPSDSEDLGKSLDEMERIYKEIKEELEVIYHLPSWVRLIPIC